MCVSQLEQFPVRLQEGPGRRGSQAIHFFNTHQIKCQLERHASAVGGGQWKRGPLRIDPLATIQVESNSPGLTYFTPLPCFRLWSVI